MLLHAETIAAVSDEWAPLPRPLIIDSGAGASVMPVTWCSNYKLEDTDLSKAGTTYQAANGEPITNLGQRVIKAVTGDGQVKTLEFHACDIVSRALGSVPSICKANNMVIFDSGGSYIYNKVTGDTTWLREEGGVYVLDLQVAPASMDVAAIHEQAFQRQGR